jgi:subtilisin family serine protease
MGVEGLKLRLLSIAFIAAVFLNVPLSFALNNDIPYVPGELIIKFNYKNYGTANRLRGKGIEQRYRQFVNLLFKKAKLSKFNKPEGRRYEPVYKSIVSESKTYGGNEAQIIERIRKNNKYNRFHSSRKEYGLLRTVIIRVDKGRDMKALASSLLKKFKTFSNFEIISITPNFILQAQFDPNDPEAVNNSQYAINMLNLRSAWETSMGSSNVAIAIIDTGVETSHPDLSAKIWINPGEIAGNNADDDQNNFVDDFQGYDFLESSSSDCAATEDCSVRDGNVADTQGHGTQVAGIAAASTNNSIGIAGACPNCKILPLRAAFRAPDSATPPDPRGLPFLKGADAAAAIVYAAERQIDVINISYAGLDPDTIPRPAFDVANDQGCVVVASAGNRGTNEETYPAALPGVISVQSVNQNAELSPTSSFGAWVDVGAPGVSILTTTINGEYVFKSGTSFAAPYIAGIAGLMRTVNPNLYAENIEALLKRYLTNPDTKLVDASKSLFDVPQYGNDIVSTRTPTPSATYTPRPATPVPVVTNTPTPGPGTPTIPPGPTLPPQPTAASNTPSASNEGMFKVYVFDKKTKKILPSSAKAVARFVSTKGIKKIKVVGGSASAVFPKGSKVAVAVSAKGYIETSTGAKTVKDDINQRIYLTKRR